MATDHDDDLDDLDPGPVPDPDAEPTAAERARARAFAELVDKVVAGRAPAAMPAEDRALIEVATVIRAATGRVELPAARRSALVEQALQRALESGGRHSGQMTAVAPPAPLARPKTADVIPIGSRRASRAPWLIAGASTAIAAAAMLILVLRPAKTRLRPSVEVAAIGAVQQHQAAVAAELPARLRSRPADTIVGVIPQERAGDASDRLDAIFADRLDGYRTLSLAGPARRGGR